MRVSREQRQAIAAKRRRRANGQFAEEPDKVKVAKKKKKKAIETPKYSPTTQSFIDKGKLFASKHLGSEDLKKVYLEKIALKEEVDALAAKYVAKGADKAAIAKQFEAVNLRIKTLDSKEEGIGEGMMGSLRDDLYKKDSEYKKPTITIDKSTKEVVKSKELKQDVDEFFTLTGGKGSKSLKEIVLDDDRAWASAYTGEVNIGRHKDDVSRRRTLYHELGHHVEYESKDIQKASQDFVKSRATGAEESLAKLTGNKGYDKDEVAYPDKFIHHYVGKLYGNGHTEVVSMGLEHFSRPSDMYRLYKKDPEHFYLILGMLNG